MSTVSLTRAEWEQAGRQRYGTDMMQWRFRCPSCGHVASPADWHAAEAPEGAIAFACVGRWTGTKVEAFNKRGEGPCHYTGGGLFKLSPIIVEDGDAKHQLFDFEDALVVPEVAS